jgi:Ser/Thr protein kinase RdoA (MazF antagonist)
VFLKLYTGPDWPLTQVSSTLRVQEFLFAAGHPVPRPLGPALQRPEGVLVCMAFLPGSRIDQPGPVSAGAAGRALGRIHRDLARLPVETPPPVPSGEAIIERAHQLLDALRTRGHGDEMDNLALEAAQFRLAWLERHPIDPALYAGARAQWVHGDYYPGNLLYTAPDALSGVVDFDFASVRFPGMEMARAVVECALRPDGRFDAPTASAFLAGYLAEHDLPPRERTSGFRIWLEHLLGSLYPLPLRYAGAALPHGWERLARRRHDLMRFVAENLADLERLAAIT